LSVGLARAETLLDCLSGRPGPEVDWDEVVETAVSHGAAPLLFRRLKRGGMRGRLPARAWDRLRSNYLAGAGRNRRLFHHLEPVLGALRRAGIPVIVLKGAFLAGAVYDDPALRPMCDADLMVPRAEIARALATLLDLGGTTARSPDIDATCRLSAHLPPVVIRELTVELHWTIVEPTGPVRVDVDGLWRRARPAVVAGVDVLALCPDDLLLHLGVGAASRDRLATGLRPLCDIAATVDRFRDELDWTRVARRAREWSAARHVGLVLALVRDLFASGVPDRAIADLVPGGIERRVLALAREAALGRTGYAGFPTLFDLLGARTFGAKLKLAWHRVFLSRAELADRYPDSRNSRLPGRFYWRRVRDVTRTWRLHARARGRLNSAGPSGDVSLAEWLNAGTR
jgi:hypothetical protein